MSHERDSGGVRPWKRLLVVGHHGGLDHVIRRLLEADAYRVQMCDYPADAEIICSTRSPDLLVLLSDWPDFTRGFVSGIRQFSRVPILVVCDPASEPPPRVFEFGADDVVAFGIAIDELTARIKALVRRATGTFSRGSQTIMPGVVLDTGRQRLQLGEREFALTGREFRFLLALSANPGNTVTFLDLAEAIWGTRLRDDDALRALVKRLRVKLGEARPLVHAHYGIGYYLDTACAEVVPR